MPKGFNLPVLGFEPYDKAMLDFFTLNLYPDINDVENVVVIKPAMGSPRREQGSLEKLHPEAAVGQTDRGLKTVPLPSAALNRLFWLFDLKRWSRSTYRKLEWTEEGRRVIQSDYPVPYDITYQLDLWTKYRVHMNQLVNEVALKFLAREVPLTVDLGNPWGERTILVTMKYNGPRDLTDLDPGVKDRTIRMMFEFVMHAWIMPAPTSLPTVRKTVQTMYIGDAATEYPNLPDETAEDTGWTQVNQKVETSLEITPDEENP